MNRLLFAATLVLASAPAAAQSVAQRTANDGNVILSGIPEIPASLAERFGPYQEVRSASIADWTSDGSGIYISTRFGDVAQLHRVDAPGGARRQITFFREPVSRAQRRPRSGELIFSMDQGGGEFYQLFLLDPSTGRARRLTDGGRTRNQFGAWSPDGRRFAFTSTRRDGRSNDIWVMDPADTASARLVLRSGDGSLWSAADFSPDGRRLLVRQYLSAADSRIHSVDLGTGARTLLAGGEKRPGSYAAVRPQFDATGSGIFFATDAEGEYQQLIHMVLGSGEWHRLSAHLEADVEGFAISDDGSRAAFVTNQGGISRLHLMDLVKHATEPASGVPTGVVAGMEFSPDGRRLALTLNSATSPSDVYTLELGDQPLRPSGLTRWTFSEVGGLNPASFVEPELIQYRSFDGLTIPAFVYRPRSQGPHPVVVLIHGGPESQSRPGFSSVVQSWVNELGVAVVVPNVRGSSGYGKTYLSLDNAMKREDSVRDIGALLDWIAARPELDQSRVMVYGGSYGGYMVLASMVHYGDRLRGGVDIVGISDFVTFLENTESYRRDLRRVEYGDERDPQMRAFFERISPKRQAARITAPLFVIQGHNDPRVPVTESEQIVQEVRAAGRPVWYMKAMNEGHGFARRENQDLMRDAVVLFFERYLLPKH